MRHVGIPWGDWMTKGDRSGGGGNEERENPLKRKNPKRHGKTPRMACRAGLCVGQGRLAAEEHPRTPAASWPIVGGGWMMESREGHTLVS